MPSGACRRRAGSPCGSAESAGCYRNRSCVLRAGVATPAHAATLCATSTCSGGAGGGSVRPRRGPGVRRSVRPVRRGSDGVRWSWCSPPLQGGDALLPSRTQVASSRGPALAIDSVLLLCSCLCEKCGCCLIVDNNGRRCRPSHAQHARLVACQR